MKAFAVGQRWASAAESELGLGVVTETDNRRVTLLFPIADEKRTTPLLKRLCIAFSLIKVIPFREGQSGHVLGVENNKAT